MTHTSQKWAFFFSVLLVVTGQIHKLTEISWFMKFGGVNNKQMCFTTARPQQIQRRNYHTFWKISKNCIISLHVHVHCVFNINNAKQTKWKKKVHYHSLASCSIVCVCVCVWMSAWTMWEFLLCEHTYIVCQLIRCILLFSMHFSCLCIS